MVILNYRSRSHICLSVLPPVYITLQKSLFYCQIPGSLEAPWIPRGTIVEPEDFWGYQVGLDKNYQDEKTSFLEKIALGEN